MNAVLCIISFFLSAFVLERAAGEMKSCYACKVENSPVWSECWNASSEAIPTVECEGACFTSMFQSGGNHLENYWNVERGCKVGECSRSDNCLSQHYGACHYCCDSNLCNTYVMSAAPFVGISSVFLLLSACLSCIAVWV